MIPLIESGAAEVATREESPIMNEERGQVSPVNQPSNPVMGAPTRGTVCPELDGRKLSPIDVEMLERATSRIRA